MIEIAAALAMLVALLLGGGEPPRDEHKHYEDGSGFGSLRSPQLTVRYWSGAMDSPGDSFGIEVTR